MSIATDFRWQKEPQKSYWHRPGGNKSHYLAIDTDLRSNISPPPGYDTVSYQAASR